MKLTPFLDSKRIAEAMLTVSFFINFYIAYVNYSVNIYTNSYYLLDLFGIFVLSVASGNYHYSKYKYMKNNEVINVTSNELLEPFVYDKYAIQVAFIFGANNYIFGKWDLQLILYIYLEFIT
jgi:hypothetical protein